jgi:hypothetical protein
MNFLKNWWAKLNWQAKTSVLLGLWFSGSIASIFLANLFASEWMLFASDHGTKATVLFSLAVLLLILIVVSTDRKDKSTRSISLSLSEVTLGAIAFTFFGMLIKGPAAEISAAQLDLLVTDGTAGATLTVLFCLETLLFFAFKKAKNAAQGQLNSQQQHQQYQHRQ